MDKILSPESFTRFSSKFIKFEIENQIIPSGNFDSLNKFLRDSSTKKHFPALGEATISGLLVTADEKTGLAVEAKPIIFGGALQQKF